MNVCTLVLISKTQGRGGGGGGAQGLAIAEGQQCVSVEHHTITTTSARTRSHTRGRAHTKHTNLSPPSALAHICRSTPQHQTFSAANATSSVLKLIRNRTSRGCRFCINSSSTTSSSSPMLSSDAVGSEQRATCLLITYACMHARAHTNDPQGRNDRQVGRRGRVRRRRAGRLKGLRQVRGRGRETRAETECSCHF